MSTSGALQCGNPSVWRPASGRRPASGAERRIRIGALLALVLLASCAGTLAWSQGLGNPHGGDFGVTLIDDIDPTQVDALAVLFPGIDDPQQKPAPNPADLQIDLQSRLKDVEITHTPLGDIVRLQTENGPVDLTAEEYLHALGAAQARVEHGGVLYRVLNISKPWSFAWICVGLLGQVMFTFRMILQWWASEKHKRSIVPVGFWWGSLIGGAMLFAYFCWRKDVVGIIGQSTGVFIYARNLVLIYGGKAIENEGARPFDDPRDPRAATPRPT